MEKIDHKRELADFLKKFDSALKYGINTIRAFELAIKGNGVPNEYNISQLFEVLNDLGKGSKKIAYDMRMMNYPNAGLVKTMNIMVNGIDCAMRTGRQYMNEGRSQADLQRWMKSLRAVLKKLNNLKQILDVERENHDKTPDNRT